MSENILILHKTMGFARKIVGDPLKKYMAQNGQQYSLYWANKSCFCEIYPEKIRNATYPPFVKYCFIHRSHADILNDIKIKSLVDTAELIIVFGGGSQTPILSTTNKNFVTHGADINNPMKVEYLKLKLGEDTITPQYKALNECKYIL